MTFLAGLIIGGMIGAILGVILMAALAVAGQSDRCSECTDRLADFTGRQAHGHQIK